MEACLEEDLPPTTELEEGLRNGVFLGKLANFFAPKMVSEKRIYDRDQARYKVHLHSFTFISGRLICCESPVYIMEDMNIVFGHFSVKLLHTG